MSSSDCEGQGSVVVEAGDAGWLAAVGAKVAVAAFLCPITGEFA